MSRISGSWEKALGVDREAPRIALLPRTPLSPWTREPCHTFPLMATSFSRMTNSWQISKLGTAASWCHHGAQTFPHGAHTTCQHGAHTCPHQDSQERTLYILIFLGFSKSVSFAATCKKGLSYAVILQEGTTGM